MQMQVFASLSQNKCKGSLIIFIYILVKNALYNALAPHRRAQKRPCLAMSIIHRFMRYHYDAPLHYEHTGFGVIRAVSGEGVKRNDYIIS